MTGAATNRPARHRTLVLLCADLADPPIRHDPQCLASAIRNRDDVDVVVSDRRLCADPAMPADTTAPDAVVVVCRHGHERRVELTSWLHGAGVRFDNLDVASADVSPDASATDAQAAVLRAVHSSVAGVRAERYPMLSAARPARAVAHTSRRAVLSPPTSARLPMPALDPARCRATGGCDLCVSACPRGALTSTRRGLDINAAACTGCGACVAACPNDAWRFAGYSPAQLSARIDAVLHPVGLSPPDGLVLRCADARTPPLLGHGWAEIVVPSLAAIGPGVVLQPIRLGVTAVHLAACGDGHCRDAATSIAELSDILLTRLGHCGKVTSVPTPRGQPPGRRFEAPAVTCPQVREPDATVDVVTSLIGPPLHVAHPAAPLGQVTVDQQRCTGCEACVSACPASALSVDHDADWVLAYEPRACLGCDICSRTCPEHAITVQRVIDTDLLAGSHIELCRQPQQSCAACGRPLTDPGVRRVVASRLVAQSPEAATLTATTCGRCGPAALGTDLPTLPHLPVTEPTAPR